MQFSLLCDLMALRTEFVEWSEAKNNERVRPAYLNGVLDRFAEIGIHEWAYIDRIQYDPGLEELHGKYGRGQAIYSDGSGNFTPLMVTAEKAGMIFTVVSDLVFEFECEDDFLSCIDHESTHSCVIRTGNLTLPVSLKDDSGKKLDLSEDLTGISYELAGFSKQFETMGQENRKLSEDFHRSNVINAKRCYKLLQKYRCRTPIEQDFARDLRESLETVGTLKYFT